MRRQTDNTVLTPEIMPLSIIDEKKSIVKNIIKATAILGVVLIFFTFLRDASAKVSIVNTGVNIVFVFILLLSLWGDKRINYKVRGWLIIVCFLFMGTKSMLIAGSVTFGLNFFLFTSMVGLLILEDRNIKIVIVVSSSIYFTIVVLQGLNIIQPLIPISESLNSPIRWMIEIAFYTFLLFILIAGVGRMQKSFLNSIHELDQTNQKLNQYNEELINQLEYSKEMEGKVTEKEVNFKTLFEESNDGIIVCNAEGVILEANKTISTMIDYPKTFLVGFHSSDFVTSDEKQAINELSIDKISSSKLRELNLITKHGDLIPVEVNYSVIQYNNRKSILVTIRDIQERKLTEQRVLSAVIQAEENERSRFAKDLHDDLGPILSSIKLYIQSLRQHEDSADKKELISRLITTVDDSVKSIRKISYNLSSYLLQNMGLTNALKTHVERINTSSSFQIMFDHNFEEDFRLPTTIEIVIYRIVLELITNSTKHSWGTQINVELKLSKNHLLVNYADDGIGFDIEKTLADNTKGIGLKNIISRVKSIQGLLTFGNSKEGFSLSIYIPL